MSTKKTKNKQRNKESSAAENTSEKQSDSKHILFDRLEKMAKNRTDLFFGLGGWFFAVVSFGVTILVYCVHLSMYHYEVGYYHEYFGVPMMYIPEPLSNGATYFAIECLVLFILIVLLFVSTNHIDEFGTKQFTVVLIGITMALSLRYKFFLPLAGNSLPTEIELIYYALYFCLFGLPLLIFIYLCIKILSKDGFSDDSPHKKKTHRASNAIYLVICYVLYMAMYVTIPTKVGYKHASNTQSMAIVSSNEETKTQLADFGLEDISFWAVLYQTDEGTVVSPCVLTENKVSIYSDYYCFIESDSLVHCVKTYDTIEVIRNDTDEEISITP